MSANTLVVNNAGLTIVAGTLSLASGSATLTGNLNIPVGALSIASTTTSTAMLDVYASSAAFTSNVISARVPTGATFAAVQLSSSASANLLQVGAAWLCSCRGV